MNTNEAQVSRLLKLEEEAWSANEQHIIWPGYSLNQAIGSWDEGILFLSGLENAGKSSWLIHTCTGVLELNEDVDILDISLDDSFKERTRRYLGILVGLRTELVARPIKATDEQLKMRAKGYKLLSEYLKEGRLEIKTAADDDFGDPETIENRIRTFVAERPGRKVIVVIDGFHDINLPESKGDEPDKVVFKKLDKAIKETGAVAIMTAHKRKSSTSEFSRKTTNDELKGSAFMKYGAKIMLVIHNEVKVKRGRAEIFYCLPDDPSTRMPVLEVSVQKNKSSDWDDWIFYTFLPATGRCIEASREQSRDFKQIALESLNYTPRKY